MHVVVVVRGQHFDDRRRPCQPGVRSHEHVRRAGGDEPVDQVLREPPVDLPRADGRALAAVEARVVDVCVEAVLVRGVARRAELRAERAAGRAREVADADAGRRRMGGLVVADHRDERAYESVGGVPPPRTVRRVLQDEVPGEEARALGGEPSALHQAPLPREPHRVRPGRLRSRRHRPRERGCEADRG